MQTSHDPGLAALPAKLAERLEPEFRNPMRLTDRELHCLALAACGYSRREIGALLHISHWTVATHWNNAREKVGGRNITHAVAVGLLTGALPAELVRN